MTLRIESKLAIQPGTAAGEAATKGQLDLGVTDAKDRSKHTGTQPSSTISDFNAAVNALIQAVVGAAPEALDTLQELAAALGNDPNFATTILSQLSDLDTRVDAVEAGGRRSVSALLGDGVASRFLVTHGWALANKDKVVAEVVDTLTGETVLTRVVRTDTSNVTVDFGSGVPAVNQYRVLLLEVIG